MPIGAAIEEAIEETEEGTLGTTMTGSPLMQVKTSEGVIEDVDLDKIMMMITMEEASERAVAEAITVCLEAETIEEVSAIEEDIAEEEATEEASTETTIEVEDSEGDSEEEPVVVAEEASTAVMTNTWEEEKISLSQWERSMMTMQTTSEGKMTFGVRNHNLPSKMMVGSQFHKASHLIMFGTQEILRRNLSQAMLSVHLLKKDPNLQGAMSGAQVLNKIKLFPSRKQKNQRKDL